MSHVHYWPGCEALIRGLTPTFCRPYEPGLTVEHFSDAIGRALESLKRGHIQFACMSLTYWYPKEMTVFFFKTHLWNNLSNFSEIYFLEFNWQYVSLGLSWLRYQMETFSALLALCEGHPSVTGAFPSQKPVTLWCFLWSGSEQAKQSRRWLFETPSCSLWLHCNDYSSVPNLNQ